MLIDAHVHIFPKVDGYGPKGHTHGAGYGRIDAGDGIAQDVLPAINENTSHTLQMLLHEMRQGRVDKAVLILCPCYGCLLYTSPSPRDRQKSRMPSSA